MLQQLNCQCRAQFFSLHLPAISFNLLNLSLSLKYTPFALDTVAIRPQVSLSATHLALTIKFKELSSNSFPTFIVLLIHLFSYYFHLPSVSHPFTSFIFLSFFLEPSGSLQFFLTNCIILLKSSESLKYTDMSVGMGVLYSLFP